MSDYSLSINPGNGRHGNHDSSVVLLKEGEVVFGLEEERLNRVKHSPLTFPKKSIRKSLEYEGLDFHDIDKLYISWSPRRKLRQAPFFFSNALRADGLTKKLFNLEKGFRKTFSSILSPFHGIRDIMEDEWGYVPDIKTVPHHRSHALSAYYPSGFDEALVLTIDGRGEYESTVVWKAEDGQLERLKTFEFPNSLGYFYAVATEYLGFDSMNGEGKFMGLAPYGERNEDIEQALHGLIDVGAEYDVTELTRDDVVGGVKRLEEAFDRERKREEDGFDKWDKDFAFSVQEALENIVVSLIKKYTSITGINDVAIAGGVALNCKMNMSIREKDFVEGLFMQPVANDAGSALGPAYEASGTGAIDSFDVYLGPEYSEEEIEELLERCEIDYRKIENAPEEAAKAISSGEVVGWFQGRVEMGPRALGNRSILADPRKEETREKVNKKVKNRENWRPFAPSVISGAAEEYFVESDIAPFMIQAFQVREEKRDEIPAVIHPGDGSARPQMLDGTRNPIFYRLVETFDDITEVPMVLNTSFNKRGEPIVNTPEEAVQDFYSTGLDRLFLESFMIEK